LQQELLLLLVCQITSSSRQQSHLVVEGGLHTDLIMNFTLHLTTVTVLR
jgi:hypothetical protein